MSTETTDPVAATLAAIRERSDHPLGPDAGAMPISNDAIRHLMESASDVPRLLAAVEAVLKRHVPRVVTVHSCSGQDALRRLHRLGKCPDCSERKVTTCVACDPLCPDDNVWPCEDYQAISRALLGEEDGDG